MGGPGSSYCTRTRSQESNLSGTAIRQADESCQRKMRDLLSLPLAQQRSSLERGQRPRHGSSPRAALEGRLGGGNANWTPAELATLAELTKDAPVTLETQDTIAAQLGTNRTGIAVYRHWLRITPKADRSGNPRVENPAHPRKPKAGASGGWASGGATDAKTKVCLPSTPACNISAAG